MTVPAYLTIYVLAGSAAVILSLFPLVLVPAYLVPLSILLHLASLAKLRMRSVIGRRRELDSASAT